MYFFKHIYKYIERGREREKERERGREMERDRYRETSPCTFILHTNIFLFSLSFQIM